MERCKICKQIKIKKIVWENEKCIEKLICINSKCEKCDKTGNNFYII